MMSLDASKWASTPPIRRVAQRRATFGVRKLKVDTLLELYFSHLLESERGSVGELYPHRSAALQTTSTCVPLNLSVWVRRRNRLEVEVDGWVWLGNNGFEGGGEAHPGWEVPESLSSVILCFFPFARIQVYDYNWLSVHREVFVYVFRTLQYSCWYHRH